MFTKFEITSFLKNSTLVVYNNKLIFSVEKIRQEFMKDNPELNICCNSMKKVLFGFSRKTRYDIYRDRFKVISDRNLTREIIAYIYENFTYDEIYSRVFDIDRFENTLLNRIYSR